MGVVTHEVARHVLQEAGELYVVGEFVPGAVVLKMTEHCIAATTEHVSDVPGLVVVVEARTVHRVGAQHALTTLRCE